MRNRQIISLGRRKCYVFFDIEKAYDVFCEMRTQTPVNETMYEDYIK